MFELEICDFAISFETENILFEVYPSVGTVILGLIFIIVAGYTTLKILNDIIMLIKIRKTKKDKAIEELIEKEVERRLQYDSIFNDNN